MTPLQEGIKVKITKEEYNKLENSKGFLQIENYPESYKDVQLPGEIGRFLRFRFFKDDTHDNDST